MDAALASPPLESQWDQRSGAHQSPPIRVGFVMHVMQVAGAEVLVKQIIERLGDRIEATVFCLDSLGELGQQLLDVGVPVVVLGRQPGLDRSVAKKLAAEVRSRGIEILHAHQYTPFFYSALARVFGRARCKIIFTEHGRHYPDIVSWKRHWANRLFLSRYADVATACCDFSTEAVRRIEGFPRAFTLPNGVDLHQLPARGSAAEQQALRQRLGLDPDRQYVACIARFHQVKDHPTLLRAWREVQREQPEARLLLVGDGPERPACEALVRELQIGDSVEFWGIRHDVADILRAIDVFALTSVSEAASLTLLEAMASGCAVALTDVGGNAEIATEGVHGFLTPRGDHRRLAQRLSELLSTPQLTRQFGAAARARVVESFALSDVIDSYFQQYASLATGRDLKAGR